MRFIKQQDSLKVQNFDFINNKQCKKQKHGPLLPNNIRCLIVGPSNCGKTNVMITMLLNSNALKFENIYIYSKSLHQPKYKYLKRIITSIPQIGFFMITNNCDVLPPEDAKKKFNIYLR